MREEEDLVNDSNFEARSDQRISPYRPTEANMGEPQPSGGQQSHNTQAMLMRTPPPPADVDMDDVEEIERDADMNQDDADVNADVNGIKRFEFSPLVRYVPPPCRKRDRASGVRNFESLQDKRQRIGYGSQGPEDDSQDTFEHPFAAACDVNDPEAGKTSQPAVCAGALPAIQETEEKDRGQVLSRERHSKTPGGRHRRMSSVRLPLETIPALSGTHHLQTTIQTSTDGVSKSMDTQATMGFEATYEANVAPESLKLVLEFTSTEDVIDVENRLKGVVISSMDDVEITYTLQDRVKGKGQTS